MDRNRALARLRTTLLEYFPALERTFNYAHRRGALMLLTRFQTPTAIRQAGLIRISAWLRKRGAYRPDIIAQSAVAADCGLPAYGRTRTADSRQNRRTARSAGHRSRR
jgi:hypothetical protein